ncbi:MAG: endo-1,4-beta-xylanase [Bacteroidales bacterium]|nr:endo-1,4-beta-xylanase [Bacteroidales bacterium]
MLIISTSHDYIIRSRSGVRQSGHDSERTNAIYKLASHLKEKGLIDGIGMQGHMGLSYPAIYEGHDNWKTALEKFGQLGLEIHITELTINTDNPSPNKDLINVQAARYAELFRLFNEMKTRSSKGANITSVTVFGLMDNYLLYDNDTQTSRLFDGNLQPKPSFYSVVQPNLPWELTKELYEELLPKEK